MLNPHNYHPPPHTQIISQPNRRYNAHQVQTLPAWQLLRPERRLTGWAKAATRAVPGLVVQLSELPAGVVNNQMVCAVTLLVPHTCRNRAAPAAADADIAEVRALPGPVTICSIPPNSARAQRRLSHSGGGARGHFYRDGLIPFFGALSVGHEGLDGPTDRVGAAGEVRPRRQTVRSHSTVDPSHTA